MTISDAIKALFGAEKRYESVEFDKLTLTRNWCTAENKEYELLKTQDGMLCKSYFGRWNGDEEREEYLEKSVTLDMQEYNEWCTKLAEWGVPDWFGKRYENPGVLDGEGFTLSLCSGGERKNVGGTNSFPKNFWDFEKTINEIFA